MTWSPWNHFTIHATEDIILANAKALVTTGLHKLGYNLVYELNNHLPLSLSLTHTHTLSLSPTTLVVEICYCYLAASPMIHRFTLPPHN